MIVTAGRGWVQQWGGQVEEIRQGDVVWIPPGVKHWHGATASTSVTHIAIQESLNGKTVEWMEKVSDEQYGNSQATSGGEAGVTKEPAVAQKLFGDFDPKLAEIAMQGDRAKAHVAYQYFLTLWKDADPDIPILKQAKTEYVKLQ